MADEIDRAQELALRYNEIAARDRRLVLPSIGICHYCSEAVPGNAKFCDSECADEHERESELRRRQGKAP